MCENRENDEIVKLILEKIIQELPISPETCENGFPEVGFECKEEMEREFNDPEDFHVEWKKIKKFSMAYWVSWKNEKNENDWKIYQDSAVQTGEVEGRLKGILKHAGGQKKHFNKIRIRFESPGAIDNGTAEQIPSPQISRTRRVLKWAKGLFCGCWKVANGDEDD